MVLKNLCKSLMFLSFPLYLCYDPPKTVFKVLQIKLHSVKDQPYCFVVNSEAFPVVQASLSSHSNSLSPRGLLEMFLSLVWHIGLEWFIPLHLSSLSPLTCLLVSFIFTFFLSFSLSVFLATMCPDSRSAWTPKAEKAKRQVPLLEIELPPEVNAKWDYHIWPLLNLNGKIQH